MKATCFESLVASPVVLARLPGRFAGTELALQGWPAWVGLPLAMLIILSPVACLILFALSLSENRPQLFKQRCARVVFVLPLVALALYVVYEAGIPPEVNIRIDLLLIYPVLVVDFLFWPALLVRYLVSRRG